MGCLFISVAILFGKSKKTFIAILCIGAGICTRMMMGFSASVFASGYRTQLIFLTSMIIISNLILEENDEEKLSSYTNLLIPFVCISIINNLCVIFK